MCNFLSYSVCVIVCIFVLLCGIFLPSGVINDDYIMLHKAGPRSKSRTALCNWGTYVELVFWSEVAGQVALLPQTRIRALHKSGQDDHNILLRADIISFTSAV